MGLDEENRLGSSTNRQASVVLPKKRISCCVDFFAKGPRVVF